MNRHDVIFIFFFVSYFSSCICGLYKVSRIVLGSVLEWIIMLFLTKYVSADFSSPCLNQLAMKTHGLISQPWFTLSVRTGVSINCRYGMYWYIPSVQTYSTWEHINIPLVPSDKLRYDEPCSQHHKPTRRMFKAHLDYLSTCWTLAFVLYCIN